MLLSILIPCLNEEKTIVRAVKNAFDAAQKNKISSFEIIVADNGSTDKSIEKIRKQKIASIIQVPTKGYGATLHWGIIHSKGRFVLYADVDLSYDFGELKNFLPYISENSKTDLILGSRFKGKILKGAMPFLHRYLGTPILTLLINLIYNFSTTDCNSGMRMVRRNFYQSLNMKNAGMEWASELLIRSALVKAKYIEVPITLYPDKRGKKPHLSSWADGWRHLKAIILIKPKLLFVVTAIFIVFGVLFLSFNKLVSLFFIMTAITLFFCALAAILIKDSLDKNESKISIVLTKLPLVKIAFISFSSALIMFFLYPNDYVLVKFLLLNVTLVYCIWVFFLETIKTHLINKLPAK